MWKNLFTRNYLTTQIECQTVSRKFQIIIFTQQRELREQQLNLYHNLLLARCQSDTIKSKLDNKACQFGTQYKLCFRHSAFRIDLLAANEGSAESVRFLNKFFVVAHLFQDEFIISRKR